MQNQRFNSLNEAIANCTTRDKTYKFLRHKFRAGKTIKAHKHRVDEYIVADNGAFLVTIGGKSTRHIGIQRSVWVIHIPAGAEHSFEVVRDISYYVIREIKKKKI